MPTIAQPRPIKILAVTDSDSYVKWAAATLEQLDERFAPAILAVRSPIAPSPSQWSTALHATRYAGQELELLSMPALQHTLHASNPDIVLLAGTGPVMEVVAEIAVRLPRPPALISGIPGMALPARRKGIEFRSRVHSMIVHSRHEQVEYGALMDSMGVSQNLVLSHLPFLPPRSEPCTDPITSLVFTPQALVPHSAAQRSRILLALHAAAINHPTVRVIVKVRALAGERQTHNERFPYDALWEELCQADPTLDPGAVEFKTGPLVDYLVPGAAHVTVSSTAALESMAAGLPTMILSDFGVNERLLNSVYAQSGCVGGLADMTELNFGTPSAQWLTDNYFHDEPSQLPAHLMELAAATRSGQLPRYPILNRHKHRRRIARNWLRSTISPGMLQALAATLGGLKCALKKVL